MRNLIKHLMLGLFLCSVFPAAGHINPKLQGIQNGNMTSASLRDDCDVGLETIEQATNNVRATLLTGGDIWWNGDDARYVVPKVDPASGLPEVSAIFAGAVWLGGFDPGMNLKVACQQYGTASGNTDFWPGPLTETGTTSQDDCANWDRFFTVTGEEIEEHLGHYQAAISSGGDYNPDLIPEKVKFWPARGNQYFNDPGGYDFELPDNTQGLAAFFDRDGDGNYEPEDGDYPRIEIRGCPPVFYPDEMIFWIYNDAGNVHTETNGDVIRMEVQVQAFAYATNDEINDMTFMRYKLINRATQDIDSTFFAMWVDADLGCYTDDYIGCDTSRSLMYIYNEDSEDGQTGCSCPGGVNTYCDEIPVLGVDYFRGPLGPKVFNSLGELVNPVLGQEADTIVELGMSSFTYYNNGGLDPAPPPGTDDPGVDIEFYRLMSGSWTDGTRFTAGGDGYNPGSTDYVNYVFPDAPDDVTGWNMTSEALPAGDRRTVQASGPFRLEPGAVNELIVGVVFVPDVDHPNPDISSLQSADDVAQALFDACFKIPNGPDAPDIDWIELDREIVAVLSNDTLSSSPSRNTFEMYTEEDIRNDIPGPEGLYRFEGYKLFQFSGPDITSSDLRDPDPSKVRLVAKVDLKNNVRELYNWVSIKNPSGDPAFLWVPEIKVDDAENEGIRHLFSIKEDQFASEDRRLINHKKYYFTAVAYGHNNFMQFDPISVIGQKNPYLEGRKNIGDKVAATDYYTVVPRPIIDRKLGSGFGDGPSITRLEGVGVGNNFLRLTDESSRAIFSGSDGGEIVYQPGSGPIDITVFDPLELVEADFELTIIDSTENDAQIPGISRWVLRELDENGGTIATIESELSIDRLNEQILPEYGFAVGIGQTEEAGQSPNDGNGVIGYESSYADVNGSLWYSGIPDGGGPDPFYNFVKTEAEGINFARDPKQEYTNLGDRTWIPYTLMDATPAGGNEFISPAWQNSFNDVVYAQNPLDSLNNVDIVFTSNKEMWSKCVVVETANDFYYDDQGLQTEGGAKNFDLRAGTSVNRDGSPNAADGTGMGWFPGYAIDVETGERLNIFFGENSTLSCEEEVISLLCDGGSYLSGPPTGRDMIWNPTSERFVNTGLPFFNVLNILDGGQHHIYVTRQPYDECAQIREKLGSPNETQKVQALKFVTWTSAALIAEDEALLPLSEGLIPNDYKVSVRVKNPYGRVNGTGTNVNDLNPTYLFSTAGLGPQELVTDEEKDSALDMINVVPNPYYGYSSYEVSQFTTVVKVTNLPAKCVVTIYSLDGKYIRQYKRDAQGVSTEGRANPSIESSQYSPDIEWDLKNAKGIPVASGVYLIHIDANEMDMGERVIKWFGVARQFDPSGL